MPLWIRMTDRIIQFYCQRLLLTRFLSSFPRGYTYPSPKCVIDSFRCHSFSATKICTSSVLTNSIIASFLALCCESLLSLARSQALCRSSETILSMLIMIQHKFLTLFIVILIAFTYTGSLNIDVVNIRSIRI